MVFTAFDIVASIHNFIGSTDGINPFWKLALVFKCLTDTIMLDDFKTELKRLGIKRMRDDELRRQSFAMVADTLESKDDDGHTEFSEAIRVSPARLQSQQRLNDGASPGQMVSLGAESVAHSPRASNNYVGKAGKKISRLPGLKDLSLKSGRKKTKVDDEEKQEDDDSSTSAAPDRLSQMRKSLGVIDYHPR